VAKVSADWAPFMTVKKSKLEIVERLLAESVEKLPDDINRRYLIEPALTEVRSMLHNDG
jgi:hypothetical protein